MIKKKFDLNSDMIQIKKNDAEEAKIEMTKLMLYVPKKFLKEFKAWCVNSEIYELGNTKAFCKGEK